MKQFDKILIVDDDDTSTFLTKSILEELQVSTHIATAANGKEALDYIDTHCVAAKKKAPAIQTSFCPGLILLDINMPVMNGFEFLEACMQKQCFKGNDVKVVMLTSSASSKDLQRAQAYQVKGYIVKPFTEEKLSKLLKE